MFKGKYAIRSGKRILEVRWKQPAFEAMKATQVEQPVKILGSGKRTVWRLRDCFYWDDENLDVEDIKALVYQRERR